MEIVILGGNGYIGREVTRQWLDRDPQAHFTIVSRSGRNELADARVSNVAADVGDVAAVAKVLPAHVDRIVCLVGGLGGREANVGPAAVMLALAEELDIPKMGYVGGKLGDKEFTSAKAEACDLLRKSGRDVAIVEPTLVYGAGRDDKLAKMVPILKFAGIFNKNMRPVRVEDVARELVNGLA